MAIIGQTFYDLIDLYKQQNPDGTQAEIIEMLTEMNPVLDDALAVECNGGTSHTHTVRTDLPTSTWGMLYKGVPQSKSGKAQVVDTTGFVEAMSHVDQRVLELSAGNEGAIRLSEAQAHIESMNNEIASKIFYGNTATDPEQFMGLAPRFNDKSAANGAQIIDAGGIGADNTSIWFVTWGDNQTHLLYPKGTKAGIHREDKGQQRVSDADGNPYFAKEELFRWNIGLAVRDSRYVARIANIDVSAVQADPTNIDGAGNSLYHFMRKAYYALHNRRVAGGRIAIYCNTDMLEALDALGTNAGGSDNFVRLSTGELDGKEVEMYRKIPIRETDALINTEALVA